MTLMRERNIDLIKRMPDEKTKAQKAYQNLQKYRHEGTVDIDYKAALHEAWKEKYENLN